MSEIPEIDRQVLRAYRAYRALGREEPPAALDAKIIAAARHNLEVVPRAGRRSFAMRWGLPLAFAAVLVLSVSLVMIMREQPGVVEISDALIPDLLETKKRSVQATAPPSAAPAAEPPGVPAPGGPPDSIARAESPAPPVAAAKQHAPANLPTERARAEGSAGAPTLQDATREARRDAEPVDRASPTGDRVKTITEREEVLREKALEAAPEQPVPPAVMAAPRVEERQSAARAPAPRASAESAVGAVTGAPTSPSMPRLSGKAGDAGTSAPSEIAKRRTPDLSTPERWLEYIDRLRKEGRDAEARESLAEFRKRHPEHPIPDALR